MKKSPIIAALIKGLTAPTDHRINTKADATSKIKRTLARNRVKVLFHIAEILMEYVDNTASKIEIEITTPFPKDTEETEKEGRAKLIITFEEGKRRVEHSTIGLKMLEQKSKMISLAYFYPEDKLQKDEIMYAIADGDTKDVFLQSSDDEIELNICELPKEAIEKLINDVIKYLTIALKRALTIIISQPLQ